MAGAVAVRLPASRAHVWFLNQLGLCLAFGREREAAGVNVPLRTLSTDLTGWQVASGEDADCCASIASGWRFCWAQQRIHLLPSATLAHCVRGIRVFLLCQHECTARRGIPPTFIALAPDGEMRFFLSFHRTALPAQQ